jgi:hypothetical protein
MQQNGTGTLFNQPGIMTVAPYGETTAWRFLGLEGPEVTATAVVYKGVEGSGSLGNGGSSEGGSATASGSGSKKGDGSVTTLDLKSFGLTVAVLVLGFI